MVAWSDRQTRAFMHICICHLIFIQKRVWQG
nr:MAG TPA: hypothetical protein [Caudoviricetes sp.]